MDANIKKALGHQIMFIVCAVFIAFFFLMGGKCEPDPYCDSDPIRGGCAQICEETDLSIGKLALRSFGVWMLLKFGEALGKQD